MSKLFTGSICLTDISENFKKKHSGFSKSEKNGKIYANVSIWINDQPDQFGNDGSINPTVDNDDLPYFLLLLWVWVSKEMLKPYLKIKIK